MGVYTVLGKNAMLNALGALATHAGLFDAQTAITGVTAEADDDTFTKTAHGLSDNDLVILSALTGGTGLTAGVPYFVRDSAANTFKLATSPGGTAVGISVDYSSLTVTELVEISGGSPAYARKAIAFSSASEGSMDDSTNGAIFDIPAGATVNYAGLFSASSGGTLYSIDDVTEETFGGQGTYTLTDADLDLLA